jgi:hypothetical protein
MAVCGPVDSTSMARGFNKPEVLMDYPFQYPRLVTPIRLLDGRGTLGKNGTGVPHAPVPQGKCFVLQTRQTRAAPHQAYLPRHSALHQADLSAVARSARADQRE